MEEGKEKENLLDNWQYVNINISILIVIIIVVVVVVIIIVVVVVLVLVGCYIIIFTTFLMEWVLS